MFVVTAVFACNDDMAIGAIEAMLIIDKNDPTQDLMHNFIAMGCDNVAANLQFLRSACVRCVWLRADVCVLCADVSGPRDSSRWDQGLPNGVSCLCFGGPRRPHVAADHGFWDAISAKERVPNPPTMFGTIEWKTGFVSSIRSLGKLRSGEGGEIADRFMAECYASEDGACPLKNDRTIRTKTSIEIAQLCSFSSPASCPTKLRQRFSMPTMVNEFHQHTECFLILHWI